MICERTRIWTDPSILRVIGAAPPPMPHLSSDGVLSIPGRRRSRRCDNPFEKYHAQVRTDLPTINLRQRTADAAARVEEWIAAYRSGVPCADVLASSGTSRPIFAARIKWYMTTDFHALLIRPRATQGNRPRVARIRVRAELPPLDDKTAVAVSRAETIIRLLRTRSASRVARSLNISKQRLYQILEWYRTLTPAPSRAPKKKPPLRRRGRKRKPSPLTREDVAAWMDLRVTLATLAKKYNTSIVTVSRWLSLDRRTDTPGNVFLEDL
jgi:hypothetical protein